MKKIFAALMMVTVSMSLLAGCGTNKPKETGNTTNQESQATTEAGQTQEETKSLAGTKIAVGRWGGNDAETAAYTQVLEDFKEKTGIEVVDRIYSDYNTELQAELIGGTAPDVFYVDAYMAPFYIQQGVLSELDAAEFEVDKFYPSMQNAFAQDGKHYAISKDSSTLALYYNTDMVKKEDIPTTLEELWGGDFLTNLKTTLPEGTAAMTYNGGDFARILYMAEMGGASVVKEDGFSNISDPKIVDNLRLIFEAAKDGKVVKPEDLGTGWNGDAFGNAKTAIMIEGNWVIGHLKTNFPNINFESIEIPTFKGEKGTMVFTVGYAMNVKTKNEAAAKEFIKYITGPEGMATWTTGAGVFPSREDVALATNVAQDPLKVAHLKGMDYETPWQKGTTMDTINTELKNYLQAYLLGERTLDEVMKISEDEANKIIQANQ